MKTMSKIFARAIRNIVRNVIEDVGCLFHAVGQIIGMYMLLGLVVGTVTLFVSRIFGKEQTVQFFNTTIVPIMFFACVAVYMIYTMVKELTIATEEVNLEEC